MERPIVRVVPKERGTPSERDASFDAGHATDTDIVSGLREGSAHAARALHARFGGRINRLVWRLLGPDTDHRDVVHQVYVNVMTSIDKLRDPTLLGQWISSVTVNTVRREIRSRGYRRIFLLSADPAIDLPEHTSTDSRLVVERFYAVLRQMRADDRIVLALHGIEGHSLPEIAALCGCSLSTAKRRLAHARAVFATAVRNDAVLALAAEGEDVD